MVGGVYSGLKPIRFNTNSGSKEDIKTNSGRVLSKLNSKYDLKELFEGLV